MVSNSEIIKNDIFRYEFVKKFLKGKILDHKSNNFTLYHSAKILLEEKADEIYSIMNLSDEELNKREFNSNNSIILSYEKNENLESKFDGVISFQNINQKNFLENVEFYHKVLKNDGTFIFSIFNTRKKTANHNEMEQFSIDEIKEKINSKFNIIEIYSQRFKEKAVVNYKAVIIRKTKKNMANILKKLGKIRKYYVKNVKSTVSKYDPYKQYFHKIPDEDFELKKYEKKHDPIFLILICKKK